MMDRTGQKAVGDDKGKGKGRDEAAVNLTLTTEVCTYRPNYSVDT